MAKDKKQLTKAQKTSIYRSILLRRKKNYTQIQLAEEITKRLPGKEYSNCQVSLWETYNRPIPQKIIPILSDIFGCTQEYLLGISEDPKKNMTYRFDPVDKIKVENGLANYHGFPLYIEFSDNQHSGRWGIYDATKDRLLCVDKILTNISKTESISLYTSMPNYETVNNFLTSPRITSIEQLLKHETVFIRYSSPDPEIRATYTGWFHLNESKTCLINSEGFTLPLEGLCRCYTAYIED